MNTESNSAFSSTQIATSSIAPDDSEGNKAAKIDVSQKQRNEYVMEQIFLHTQISTS